MSATVSTSSLEAPARVVALAWTVSPDAAQRVLGQRDDRLIIEVLARRDGSGETRLCAGSRVLDHRVHAVGAVVITRDTKRGLEHIDVEGVVSCTRRGDEVLYARAPIFAQLGIGGGSYDLAPTNDADR